MFPAGPDALQRALELLQPHGGDPRTGELHDPIYLALRDGAPLDPLVAAIRRHRGHPAAPALIALFGLEFPAPTLGEVAEKHGLISRIEPNVDLASVVDAGLSRLSEQRDLLEHRLALVDAARSRQAALANALALVGAVAAVTAVLGWAIALGLWEVDWWEPPSPPSVKPSEPPPP